MYATDEAGTLPMTAEERNRIREQLTRMLDTHHFKNSKRYPKLLRFIVEETLEGRGEFLKERWIGVSVFDRPNDYDTAADPIVRVTIAEIRKRIAQYYHDEEHDAETRIELLPGRYAPEFRARGTKRERAPIPVSEADALELNPMGVSPVADSHAIQPLPKVKGGHRRKTLLWSGGALVLVAVAALLVIRWLQPPLLNVFWSPLLNSQHPVLFCLPADAAKKRGPVDTSGLAAPDDEPQMAPGTAPASPTFRDFEALGENIVFSDMLAALHIADVLAVNHHDYRVKLNVHTNLEDLRQGPVILIGGLDNEWTLRALAPLRYHFAGSDENGYWISDTKNPADKRWSLDMKLKIGAVKRDYAIVARLHNEQTGQVEMVVAGIGMTGTAAAGEFITDESRMKELEHRLGPGFKDRDFEAVLSTDVVNGIGGTPEILAVAVW